MSEETNRKNQAVSEKTDIHEPEAEQKIEEYDEKANPDSMTVGEKIYRFCCERLQ